MHQLVSSAFAPDEPYWCGSMVRRRAVAPLRHGQRTEMARRRCYASGSQAPAARTPALSIIDNQQPAAAPCLRDAAEVTHRNTVKPQSALQQPAEHAENADQSASAVVETNRCNLWNV